MRVALSLSLSLSLSHLPSALHSSSLIPGFLWKQLPLRQTQDTGASRFDLNFLCTQRKLISTILITWSYTCRMHVMMIHILRLGTQHSLALSASPKLQHHIEVKPLT